MAIEINTASAALSLARQLEEESAGYYLKLADRYPQGKDLFSGFAKENKKFITQFEMAYNSVISDALEGCFAFKIDPAKYELRLEIAPGQTYKQTIEGALELEDKLITFYTQASEQSTGLLADVPRVFNLIIKSRLKRKENLVSRA